MTNHRVEEIHLLKEGADSYVSAVSAILAFRELIHIRHRQVLEERLPEYSKALGLPLDPGVLRNYAGPPLGKWDGDWAAVGLELRNLGTARPWMYHTISWDLTNDGKWTAWLVASIWVRKQPQFEQLRTLFFPHIPEANRLEEDKEIGLCEQIAPSEMAELDGRLDSMVLKWIDLWRRVGGLKVLASGTS